MSENSDGSDSDDTGPELYWRDRGLDSAAVARRLNRLTAEARAAVTKLYLWDNRIERCPVELFSLLQLTRLHLYYNELESLPEEIALLTNLEVLGLCYNQLRELPSSLGACTKLRDLAVDNNQLTRLPPTLTRLTQLKCFWGAYNPLPKGLAVEAKYLDLTETQSLLQRIGQRFSYYGARNAAVTFMAMHRFRRAGTVWSAMGKDVIVYIIAPLLYQTRSDDAWHSADEAGWHSADEAGYGQHIAKVAEPRK